MISLSEIRNRALKFQKEWEGEKYERGEAQSFWNDFFQIFDISRRRVATFEEPIKKLGGSQGFIDLLRGTDVNPNFKPIEWKLMKVNDDELVTICDWLNSVIKKL